MGPIEYVTVNLEPTILNSLPPSDAGEVVVPPGGKDMYVVVKDDDLAYVTYTWSLDGSGRLGEGTTVNPVPDADGYIIEETNTFHLDDDVLYDGQVLTWEIRDLDTGVGDDLRDFSLSFSWTVVVP